MLKYCLLNLLVLLLFLNFTISRNDYNKTNYANKALNVVNYYRNKHFYTTSLKSNAFLQSIAQSYADQLANTNGYISITDSQKLFTKCSSNFYFDSFSNYNAYINSIDVNDVDLTTCGSSEATISYYDGNPANIQNSEKYLNTTCSPNSIVGLWYSGILIYNFTGPTNNTAVKTKDFTQLVWNSTNFIGIGVSVTNDLKRCYVVALYWPKGNIFGRYTKNVNFLKDNKTMPIFVTTSAPTSSSFKKRISIFSTCYFLILFFIKT